VQASEPRTKLRCGAALEPRRIYRHLVPFATPRHEMWGFAMAIAAILWAFKHKVSTNERVVLLELANFSDEVTWQCYPSMDTIGENTGLCRRSVLRAIASLADRGLISYEKRFTPHGQSSHDYTLNRTIKKQKTPCDSQSLPAVTHSHTYAVTHSHTEPSNLLDLIPW